MNECEEKLALGLEKQILVQVSGEAVSESASFKISIGDTKFPEPLHTFDFQNFAMARLDQLMVDLRGDESRRLGVVEFNLCLDIHDPDMPFSIYLSCADFPLPGVDDQTQVVCAEFAHKVKRGLRGILEDLTLNVLRSWGVDVEKLAPKSKSDPSVVGHGREWS